MHCAQARAEKAEAVAALRERHASELDAQLSHFQVRREAALSFLPHLLCSLPAAAKGLFGRYPEPMKPVPHPLL